MGNAERRECQIRLAAPASSGQHTRTPALARSQLPLFSLTAHQSTSAHWLVQERGASLQQPSLSSILAEAILE